MLLIAQLKAKNMKDMHMQHLGTSNELVYAYSTVYHPLWHEAQLGEQKNLNSEPLQNQTTRVADDMKPPKQKINSEQHYKRRYKSNDEE